ncbi:inhibin alpha chain [Rhinophrynus dorsalis]
MFPLQFSILFLLFLNCPRMSQSCEIPEGDRQLILAKVKSHILDALGSPPPPSTDSTPTSSPRPHLPIKPGQRTVHKRHSKRHEGNLEDMSQVILFPSSDAPCDTTSLDDASKDIGNSFTYIFRPSPHILSRRVSAAQLWFFTGGAEMADSSTPRPSKNPDKPGSVPSLQTLSQESQPPTSGSPTQYNHTVSNDPISPFNSTDVVDDDDDYDDHDNNEDSTQLSADLQILSEHESVTVATSRVQKLDDWTVFHLAPAFLTYVTRGLFVLLVHCPKCPCSDQPEYMPFIMFSTHPTQRGRRSGFPWSPSALELLQRPPALGAGSAQCHRGSLNISFEELGWDQWIVHPAGFQFHYCHGTCSPNHGLSPALHWGHCCAALPSTMKSLRVTTTTDGGFSYRYETVPNLLTQDCACS